MESICSLSVYMEMANWGAKSASSIQAGNSIDTDCSYESVWVEAKRLILKLPRQKNMKYMTG